MPTIETNPVRTPALVNQLVDLWQNNVTVTHAFVNRVDLATIALEVPDALQAIPTLLVAFDDSVPVGFLGVADKQIEMLFVLVTKRGQGIGTALLEHAIRHQNVQTVTVNEQNTTAHAFYAHHGFEVADRQPTDDAGRPYPLLTLRLKSLSSPR